MPKWDCQWSETDQIPIVYFLVFHFLKQGQGRFMVWGKKRRKKGKTVRGKEK